MKYLLIIKSFFISFLSIITVSKTSQSEAAVSVTVMPRRVTFVTRPPRVCCVTVSTTRAARSVTDAVQDLFKKLGAGQLLIVPLNVNVSC